MHTSRRSRSDIGERMPFRLSVIEADNACVNARLFRNRFPNQLVANHILFTLVPSKSVARGDADALLC